MGVVELGLWRDFAQTKRNRHHPWCENGAYALGLGALTPHGVVQANVGQKFLNSNILRIFTVIGQR